MMYSIRKTVLGCLAALSLPGCSPAPAGAPWQQAAVAAYLRKTLPTPASYQPVRWSRLTVWRLDTLAAVDLPGTQRYVQRLSAEISDDSASYALMAQTTKPPGSSAANVAILKQQYLALSQMRDSGRAHVRRMLATQHDTSTAFYQLTHTYRFKNEKGQVELDSMQFNVGKQGQVVPLEFSRYSSAAPKQELLPPPPPPSF